jgi:hypothetical protein
MSWVLYANHDAKHSAVFPEKDKVKLIIQKEAYEHTNFTFSIFNQRPNLAQ